MYKSALIIALAVFQHLNAAEAQISSVPVAKATGRIAPPYGSVIYNNLATKYPDGLYISGSGLNVCQPCGSDPDEEVAVPFTPANDRIARRIQFPVYVQGGGAEAMKDEPCGFLRDANLLRQLQG